MAFGFTSGHCYSHSLVFTLEGSWSGQSSMQLVTPVALVLEGSQTFSLVTPPLVCKGSLVSGVVTFDSSSGLWGESSSALVVGVIGDSASMSLRLGV